MTEQMIPATDWYALYLLDTDPFHSLVHLVCWILDEFPSSGTEVAGMVVGNDGKLVVRADSIEGFHMYVHQSQVNEGALRPIVGEHRTRMLEEQSAQGPAGDETQS